MSASIGDAAAVEFAEGFYDALGNGNGKGKDIEFAFKMGKNAIDMEGLPEGAVPILLKRS